MEYASLSFFSNSVFSRPCSWVSWVFFALKENHVNLPMNYLLASWKMAIRFWIWTYDYNSLITNYWVTTWKKNSVIWIYLDSASLIESEWSVLLILELKFTDKTKLRIEQILTLISLRSLYLAIFKRSKEDLRKPIAIYLLD